MPQNERADSMEHDKSSCSESAGTSDGDTVLPVAAERTMTEMLSRVRSFTMRQVICTASFTIFLAVEANKG